MEDRHGDGVTTEAVYVPLETVFESIPDPVLLIDEEFRIIEANQKAGELFDCRPEALLGSSWVECCPAGDREAFRGLVEEMPGDRVERFESGDPIRIETVAGECRPVELSIQRIYDGGDTFLFCLCREITERIEREQTLRTTVARLEALFEASPVPMAVLDTDGTIERWNRAASTTFGWEAGGVTGEQYPLFTDASTREAFLERVLAGERIAGLETTHQGKDGSLVEVELYAQPLQEGGTVTSVIVSAIDVTALKQREQHLEVLHRIMRHTLRNKLNVIYAVGERVVGSGDPSEPEFSDRLIAATKELIHLSDQIERINSDLRRVESPAPVSLDAMIAGIQEELEQSHPDATIIPPGTVPDVSVPDIARTIVGELVDHAIDHGDRQSPRIELDAKFERRVVVTITDDRERLTEAERGFLVRGESAALLYGDQLRLAHADMLASELGGQLSAVERGDETTVRLELPQAGSRPRS